MAHLWSGTPVRLHRGASHFLPLPHLRRTRLLISPTVTTSYGKAASPDLFLTFLPGSPPAADLTVHSSIGLPAARAARPPPPRPAGTRANAAWIELLSADHGWRAGELAICFGFRD
ncbi:hypothetical protein SEVIR_1G296650v4 [Setaria viridis]